MAYGSQIEAVGPFVAVQVLAPLKMQSMCQLRHPSGWVIECAQWPEAGWLTVLLGERGILCQKILHVLDGLEHALILTCLASAMRQLTC